MNNIDYLIEKQSTYLVSQKNFFKHKKLSIDLEEPKIISVTSPNKQTKYILQIQYSDPQSIAKTLYNQYLIEILELNDCKLKVVPPEILRLTKLKQLRLENNFIKQTPIIDVDILSFKNNLLTKIQVSNQVKHLDVSQNKIQIIELGKNLENLSIFANELTQLPILPKSIQTLELDWFKYTSPIMNQKQTMPKIKVLTEKSFECLEFIQHFSIEPLKNNIIKAAKSQDIGVLVSLCRCLDINHSEDGDTALSLALKNDSLFAVRQLIELGADLNIGQYDEGCILNYAIRHNLLSIVNMILPKITKDSFKIDKDGNSALHYLSFIEFDEVSHKIIHRAKMLNVGLYKNAFGQSPLHLAILKFRNKLLTTLLMLFKTDFDDLYNLACVSENYSALIILHTHNVPYEGTNKRLAWKNFRSYKLLQNCEVQSMKKHMKQFNEPLKQGFTYEVKLMESNKQKRFFPQEQNTQQLLRQYQLLSTSLTRQQQFEYFHQLVSKIRQIQKYLDDQQQLECLIDTRLILHFRKEKKIRDELSILSIDFMKIHGCEYIVKYLKPQCLPNDIILLFEYFQ